MATIQCRYSGIQFKCEHFSIHLQNDETYHPIFSVPLKRLFKYFPKWQSNELNEVDSYLYFLSLLKATDLVQFRTSAIAHANTKQIISSNMESLFYTIGKIITIRHPRFSVPQFSINKETATLTNVSEWIKLWNECYDSFCSGLKDQELRSKLQRKESALEKLIKNPALKPERYAHILADWAADAAQFPSFTITNPIDSSVINVSDYWKLIIKTCYQKESLLSIPEKDIIELIEHCEENMELGSIQSYHLFNTLREGLDTIRGFFEDNHPTSFILLDSNSDVSDATIQLMKESIGTDKPKRTDYPSEFAFFKAMMAYNIRIGGK